MRHLPAVVCCVLALLIAVLGVRPTGDGGEYLLASHALASHATPDIRVADAEWLAHRETRWRRVANHVVDGMNAGDLTPLPSIRRGTSGDYYSLHFWFYSLLAVPFLGLAELLELRPSLALVVVNALGACAAVVFLFERHKGVVAGVGALLFLLAGTTFYLGWTGPEVPTGAAVLIACLATRQGKFGVAALAAGVAAAQNPSAAFLFGYVLWGAWRRGWKPEPRDRWLAGAGLVLAGFPYLFFYYEFDVFSLIARFATDVSLISRERAWSLVFDLNEGMIVGVPGVLLGFVATVIVATRATPVPDRPALFAEVAATTLLVVGMAVPTFSIHNWNSGNSVFIRYGYWLAMPLFELGLELGSRLGPRPRVALAAGATLLQLGIVGVNGLNGENYGYLRHSWAASFVLHDFPGAYNPVPEIFYERTLGWEVAPDRAKLVVFPSHGKPIKILVRYGYAPRSERVCPDDTLISSKHEHKVSGGYKYLDRPFECRAP